MYLSDKEQLILSNLKERYPLLNNKFQVTEELLIDYVDTYHMLYGKTGKATKTNSNFKLARRLAGLTLLKVQKANGMKPTDIKGGIVYVICNPAWPMFAKIGITWDVYERLSSYQTYSPLRDFYIKSFDYVLDRRATEKVILKHPEIFNMKGEWVKFDNTTWAKVLEIISR